MKNFWKKILKIEEELLNKEGQEVNVIYKNNQEQKNKRKKTSWPIQETEKPWPEEWLSQAGQGQLMVDVYDQGSAIIIESTIAGVKPENIDITVEPDLIVIRGKREKQKEINSREYYYQECFWGNFSRTLILPAAIKPEQVKANFKNGLLIVTLPKAEEKEDQIEIKE
jgi:HSP20 family protein